MMKTLIISFTALLFGLVLNAQITLEHTYNYSATLTEIDEDEFKYYIMDVPMNQCRILNEDHSLYKTINLTVPQGYFLSDIKFVSRKTFNTDENIELLYLYSKSSLVNSEYVYAYGMKVINEQGNVLLSLQDGGFAEIKEFNGAPKLFAYQYIYSDNYYLVNTNVYSIGGGDSNSNAMTSSPSLRIFPNPASDMVRVEMRPEDLNTGGKILISDLSGKRLLDQSYGPGMRSIPVATGSLDPGTYMLNVITGDGNSVAGKITKN